MIDVNPYTRE